MTFEHLSDVALAQMCDEMRDAFDRGSETEGVLYEISCRLRAVAAVRRWAAGCDVVPVGELLPRLDGLGDEYMRSTYEPRE